MRLDALHESRIFSLSPALKREFVRIANSLGQETYQDQFHNGRDLVNVRYDPSKTDRGSTKWDPTENAFEIVIGQFDDEDDLYGILVHEYVHQIDPSAGRHGPVGKKGAEYWAHPEEFNALSNEIIHKIVKQLAELRENSPETSTIFLDRLYDLLRYPKGFADWTHFGDQIVDWWTDRPDLWKRFKSRLYNAIQDELKIDRDEEVGADFFDQYMLDLGDE